VKVKGRDNHTHRQLSYACATIKSDTGYPLIQCAGKPSKESPDQKARWTTTSVSKDNVSLFFPESSDINTSFAPGMVALVFGEARYNPLFEIVNYAVLPPRSYRICVLRHCGPSFLEVKDSELQP
jgi:hypothetical protein